MLYITNKERVKSNILFFIAYDVILIFLIKI